VLFKKLTDLSMAKQTIKGGKKMCFQNSHLQPSSAVAMLVTVTT
jgi:hypothetical protein